LSNTIRVGFVNVAQGRVLDGQRNDPSSSPKRYAEFFRSQAIDVLGLCEVPFEKRGGDGDSAFLAELTDHSLFTARVGTAIEHSWTAKGLWYGVAILSRWPLIRSDLTLIHPPSLTTVIDGTIWNMHQKAVQRAVLSIGSISVTFSNLHYFPPHRFSRSITDPIFDESKRQVTRALNEHLSAVTVIVGDFNNRGCSLAAAFPGLFAGQFKEAVRCRTTRRDCDEQVDHILYTPVGASLVDSGSVECFSDHHFIWADLSLSP
jgi:endonuclease/exonuclease/phosphatase family metal-dependent hydrolase